MSKRQESANARRVSREPPKSKVPGVVRLCTAALAALLLSACAGRPQSLPEPVVRTVTVKVATPVPCPALEALGPEPAYPDTDEAIAAAGTIGTLASLYAKGRLVRAQRLAEYIAAATACKF
jgi:hypothetical protein